MELSDFDDLIRQKLNGATDLHQAEMEKAKPFVWYAVQDRVSSKPMFRWYHLAAAVVLLFLGFSWAVFYLQKGHEKELAALSAEMQQLKAAYANQSSTNQEKDVRMKSLQSEMEQMGKELVRLKEQPHVGTLQPEIRWKTDTLVVKQVEYVTVYKEREVKKGEASALETAILANNNRSSFEKDSADAEKANDPVRDELIFAKNTKPSESSENADIKVKWGVLSKRQ